MHTPDDQILLRSVWTLNRAALVIRPRDPYVQWAAALDDEAPDVAESLRDQVSVYLVAEDHDGENETPPLDDYFDEIFVRELEAWSSDPEQWPPKRDLATFLAWFEVAGDSLVTDLGVEPLEIEEM